MEKKEAYDLIVVGAGPGGYVAAVRASQLGLKVACIEKEDRLGGVCLNVGCIPSKALLDSSEYFHLAQKHFDEHGIRTGKIQLDLERMMSRKEKVVEALTENVRKLLEGHRIDVIHGRARLTGRDVVEITPPIGKERKKFTLKAAAILLATGSGPVSVPDLQFDGKTIVSSTEALNFKSVPKHLGIVGGGYVGLEIGSVWRRLGTKVTVIEKLPNIASTMDGQISRALKRLLTNQGIEFRLKTKVLSAKITKAGVRVYLEADSKKQTLQCDRLLVAVGRRPLIDDLGVKSLGIKTNTETGRIQVDESYRTSIPTIYAVGDIIDGPMLAHKASAEGIAAAECIAGKPGEVNYDAIPSVIYTWPEVASVGLTEEQVKERQIPYCVGTYPFSGAGRARCMGETEGFVKLISHGK
ncbi:MAG: dihydrolipoyl dehydrogenase, partial [Deltaproteobacteria bacterium]|nr:dihydrolipoyl dehydrogenase [Deltaproteobacteria bacterium]